MKTIYDFVSIGIFAGLVILFLQRSTARESDPIAMWKYGVAAVGCAIGNYVGNQGQPIIAALLLVAVVVFIVIVLRPFAQNPQA